MHFVFRVALLSYRSGDDRLMYERDERADETDETRWFTQLRSRWTTGKLVSLYCLCVEKDQREVLIRDFNGTRTSISDQFDTPWSYVSYSSRICVD